MFRPGRRFVLVRRADDREPVARSATHVPRTLAGEPDLARARTARYGRDP